MWNEAGFRFPTVRDRRTSIQGPLPVGPAVQRAGQFTDFGFLLRIRVKVRGANEHTCEEKGGINRRKLAFPNPASVLHVQEVIIEAFVAGGIGFGGERAVMEKA